MSELKVKSREDQQPIIFIEDRCKSGSPQVAPASSAPSRARNIISISGNH